jgi:peptidoglycan/xylan/chitin deacetylase (PgdA/CDA1 family)
MRRYGWLCAALALALAACGGAKKPPAHPSLTATPARHRPAPRTDPAAIAARAHVPVLCWHQIRDQTAADSASDRTYIVGPKTFAAQIAALDRAGYHPVTGDALVAHLAKGAPLPSKPVLLTFDDGSEGQYERALPVLKRHHFVATFFVMTVVLGKPGWFTRGQVRALDRAGMTIGAHTWDHSNVTGYHGNDYTVQFTQPKQELTKIVGHPVRLFAYPFGVWNRRAFPHLGIASYAAAFQLSEKIDPHDPLWTIRRILVTQIPGSQLLRQMRADF